MLKLPVRLLWLMTADIIDDNGVGRIHVTYHLNGNVIPVLMICSMFGYIPIGGSIDRLYMNITFVRDDKAVFVSGPRDLR